MPLLGEEGTEGGRRDDQDAERIAEGRNDLQWCTVLLRRLLCLFIYREKKGHGATGLGLG